ncbi:alpha/beta hydrolase [Luteimonas chenhongjianii]|uniref:Alpha/beta hydrolase n=1 Tax=Luteimonas chenhongjianii TaxID=2006110 RepID=A0A290XD38_9GAMM|nr:alpha/beta hydrolase [Luteimonas chenhongjianii]ATD67037.1 alpha/beta hydrolase [Luteimonas chenhongjianii]
MRRSSRACIAAALALLVCGCQSAFFGYVNRGTGEPDATAVYDDTRGLALDIYQPQDAAPGAPVVLFFYGGAWQYGERDQYRFVGRRLAENGVVAVVADYRTWPDSGFPGFVEDGARAVRWTRDHAAEYGGDPERLFLAGHSAGAQIAALLGTDARRLEAVGLEPVDLAGIIGLSGPYDFTINGKYEAIFGPRAQWPEAMPVRFVDGDEPPFLLIHGDADHTVDIGNSRKLDFALRRKGVASTLIVLPGGNHFLPAAAFYDPERSPEVLQAVLRFIGTDAAEADAQAK